MEPRSHNLYGVPVTLNEYQRLTFVLTNEFQATGIKPTKIIVKDLVRSDRHPSKELKANMAQFDKEMDESYRLNKR